jgi:hypothetical protein
MKHIALSLFLASGFALAQDIPSQESLDAYAAYATCRSNAPKISDCEQQYQRWTAAVTAELRAAIAAAIPDVEAVKAKRGAYAACCANRRWWKFRQQRCGL